jgi:hypothetical protein
MRASREFAQEAGNRHGAERPIFCTTRRQSWRWQIMKWQKEKECRLLEAAFDADPDRRAIHCSTSIAVCARKGPASGPLSNSTAR